MSASENLQPLQFFHGTSKALARKIEKTGLNEGANLTTNPDAAATYARYASGGRWGSKDKKTAGVVLAVSAHEQELRTGAYGPSDPVVTDHRVTTTQLTPERVSRHSG
jgi:hypothetical protein